MPTLTRLTLWYLSGVGWSVLFQLAPLVALLGGGAAIVVLVTRGAAIGTGWRFGFAFTIAGAVLCALALEQRMQDCRRLLSDGQTVTLSGVLQEYNARTAWLALQAIDGRPCQGTIRLLAGRATPSDAVQPGAAVEVQGEWWSDLNARPLDPPRGVLAVKEWKPAGASSTLAQLRARTAARIAALFGDQAPITAALLIAQRDEIDPKVKQDFAASGLAHLLAISGTHVALVATVLALLTSVARLPASLGNILAGIGACAYVLFLGAPYPAVRAALQILLVLAARAAQRPAHPLGLLAAAGISILLYDPLALLDAGFQLSFAGLIGIILWRRPLIERQPQSWPLILRDAIATSTAASLATTPIVAYHFGQISFIAVPANLVALPLVSLAVPAAALALAVSAVSMDAARFLADGTRLLLVRLEDTAALAASVPGGHMFVTRATVIASLVALLIGYLVWRNVWFIRARFRLVTAVGMACALPVAAPFLPLGSRDSIEIHAIDVGQGDAIAIRSPRGRWVLIDAGPASDRFNAGAARVVPFLLRHHARALEVLVLTHPHLDHVGGAGAVTAVLETRLVLDPDSGRGEPAAAGEEARRFTAKRSLQARPGLHISFDGISMEVLHPAENELSAEDANDISVVLRLGFGQFAALFTGDAPARVEDQLVQQYGTRLDVDVLKIGHHGSRTSTGDAWLAASTPRIALISAGRGNRYGHPAPAVLARLEQAGIEVFRTDRSGNVSLRAFPDGRIEVLDR
jgi:competence protein ComEC